MVISLRRLLAAFLLSAFVLISKTSGAEFPGRQVTIVVPYAAGGTIDVTARIIGSKLSKRWDQPVIIENRAGGASTVGAKFVASAPPDGHTLLFTNHETFTVTPHLAQYRNWRPLSDLNPINLTTVLVDAIVVNPTLPVTTLDELVKYAKTHPNALSYSSPGVGSNVHLAMEMLKSQANVAMLHVPYRGLALATTAVMTNEVQVGMASPSSGSLIKSGQLRVIAVAGPDRFPEFLNAPATAEIGYGKVDASTYLTLAAPINTPRNIQEQINADVSQLLGDSDMKQQLLLRGLSVSNVGLDAAKRELEARFLTAAELVKIAGVDQKE